MHTLSDLLTCKLISLNNRIKKGIPFAQISKYNFDTSHLKSEFESFIKSFLLNDINQSFFQAMYNKVSTLVEQSFQDSDITFFYIQHCFENFDAMVDEVKKDMIAFYILVIKQYADSISRLDSNQFDIHIAISGLKENLLQHKFINMNTVSLYSKTENDVYLYIAISAIMEGFEQKITSLECFKIYENIITEDAGSELLIKDALILNALLTINQVESYLDRHPLNKNTYQLFMGETIPSYFTRYAKQVSNPLTLYAFEASFADKCREECMCITPEDLPELIAHSAASSRQSSPDNYAIKKSRLKM